MRKFVTIVTIFACGYLFGDSAIRIVEATWAELTGKVKPELKELQEHIESLEIKDVTR